MLDFVHFPFQNLLNPDLAGVKHEVDQLLVSGRDNTDVGNLGGRIYGAGDQTVHL